MKNLKYLVVLTLLLFLLAACGGAEEEPAEVVQPTQPPAPTVAAVPTDTPPPPPPVVSTEEETSAEAEPEPDVAAPAEQAIWPTDMYGYGIQIHGNATYGDPAAVAQTVRNQLGMDWVKMQIKWSAVKNEGPESDQWFFYDGAIDEVNKAGLYLMVSVVSAPAWTRTLGGENGPPDDLSLYVEFLNELLQRHGDDIDAIEVWNEQNLTREWATSDGVNAAAYLEMLQLAHATIKAYDPDIIVISGALAPTGFNDPQIAIDDFIYLDQLLAGGMLDYTDCVGVHHNGYNIGPDVPFDATGATAEAATASFRGPFDNIHHSWSFFTTLDVYADKVQAVDPAMKLCVTEFGWASSEGYEEIPEGFEYGRDNTLEEQATFIVQAFEQMRASGDVWLTFLFNFDFGNKGNGLTDDNVHYSLVSFPDGAPRPAFAAVAEMEKTR